jgi:hypothetical protein
MKTRRSEDRGSSVKLRGSHAPLRRIEDSGLSKRGRPRIQDEFTDRTDLTAWQKYQLRHPIERTSELAERKSRTDLGLALLSLVAKPGVSLTQQDIAAWCSCSRANIYLIEMRALKKLRNALFFRDRETWEELRSALTHEREPSCRPWMERTAA